MRLPSPIRSRATIPLGEAFLRFDKRDKLCPWSLWRRHPTLLSRDVLIVNWGGEIPREGDPTQVDGIGMEQELMRWQTWEIDQDFAAALEMLARHGIIGKRWIAKITEHIGFEPEFDADEKPDPLKWSVR